MKRRKASRTAESAAAGRAAHLRYERPVVFADPFALELTSPLWRYICKNRLLSWLVFTRIAGTMRPVGAHILARSRYAEDKLAGAMEAGAGQYVIIGAGLDSFVLRRPDLEGTLRVYELDHPASQEAKRKRLRDLGYALPGNVEFLPIDCEKETVAEVLAHSSYTPEMKTFFSWLGTTYYLSRDAVLRTLRAIAACAAAGGQLVFDYGIPKVMQPPGDRRRWRMIERAGWQCGEPILTHFTPPAIEAILVASGFEVLEHLSPAEQGARYFAHHARPFTPLASYFIHASVKEKGDVSRCVSG